MAYVGGVGGGGEQCVHMWRAVMRGRVYLAFWRGCSFPAVFPQRPGRITRKKGLGLQSQSSAEYRYLMRPFSFPFPNPRE